MKIGCPMASSQAGQIGLLGRAQEATASFGCPIALEQAAQVQPLPQRRPQQREEPGETVAPLAQPGAEAQQQIHQERGPHLPAHGLSVVSEKVGQLERLLQFLKEHFDAPAAAIQLGDGLGAPGQVVGEENHFTHLAVHFDQGHYATQAERIGFSGGRTAQQDQIVAQDIALGSVLQPAHDATLQIILGSGDPEDLPHGQIGQMLKVHIGFVKDHNFPGLHACAQFVRPPVVVLSGAVHQCKAGQEALQVEPHVTLGGRFAPTVLGPIHTPSHQLNGGRVNHMNQALEPEGEARATSSPKARMELLQMLEHRPEQRLGHFRIALPVGMRERVLAGRRCAANGRQRTGVQPQGIAHVVETQGVGELGVEQTHHMTPGAKGPRLDFHTGIARQLRHQMVGNQIAELVQEGEAAARWLVGCDFLHGLPCGRSTHRKPTSFFPHNPQTTKAMGRQWFTDWKDADKAGRHVLKISDGYFCAPEVFYFTPQKKWYLICQVNDPSRKPALQPAFSTTADMADPDSWTRPALLYARQPANVTAWIDFWVICDATRAHLFFTSNDGRMWRRGTARAASPRGWGLPAVGVRGDIFEAGHTYRLKGLNRFLTIIEAQDDGRRYYKAYLAERLDGDWKPLAATKEKPFAGPVDVRDRGPHWTDSFSHGELLRDGCEQNVAVHPADL